VPERTIEQVLNPPTTNTATKTYTVAGVDPSSPNSGLVTRSQVTSGMWFGSNPSDEVLVNTAYANTNKITAGSSLTINGTRYSVVGLVTPTLTGDVSDIYFDLATLQGLSTNQTRVNEVLVAVKSSSDVDAVAAEIRKELPGAQVLTAKSLADQVTGSLSNARKLANTLGGALAIVVLLAAFLVAALLTLSSVTKRTREIGTLRALGWSKGLVVKQLLTENLLIGLLGAALGIGAGVALCLVIGAVGPPLSVTSSGLSVGASSVSTLFHQTTTGSISSTIHLTAPVRATTLLVGLGVAVLGGMLAGVAGGMRAARLAPASALRDIG
ncbi:MAG TPA: FtsX-like permease family protein, partial [Acidimicrobiales bacterium]|nr:FtsX-like permease family protein [Acidimicrobiales bacterium]